MQWYLGVEEEGTAAASAAALANPWRASMGAFKVARGSVSSDSSSEDAAVLGTMPYVAYLCGCKENIKRDGMFIERLELTGGANPGKAGNVLRDWPG